MKIGLTFDYRNKAVKHAKNDILALGKTALKATVGITSAAVAVQKLNRFLQQSVQAAIADEKAYKVLGNTLKTAGFGAAADSVKALIDAQQLATGVAEDQLIPAYTTLFNALQSVSSAQYALQLAQDVSLATGKDLNQVTTAFARAAKGSTTALGRLGIGISKAELASSDFSTILTQLEAKFRGSTGAAIDTTAVKMDRLRVAVSEAKEEIGKGLVDAFTTATNASGTSVDKMQADIIRLGTSIGDVFRGIGGISTQFKVELPDAISNAINEGFRNAFGPYGQVFTLLKDYGAALRRETEQNAAAGLAAVYTGGPRADRASTAEIGRSMFIQQQRAAYMAEQARKRAAAAEAARKRAEEAQKKKAAALEAKTKELAQKFDLELIGLAAAKRKTTDEETLTRLTALQTLAMSAYDSEKQSINELDELIKKLTASQNQYTTAVLASAAAWAGVVTNPNAGSFRLAEQQANQGLGAGSMAPPSAAQFRQADAAMGMPSVTVNVGGSVVAQQDLQQAVLDAVNTATRGGGMLKGSPIAV